MSFSLNEVEAMAKKAARGAGYPWGLAEEASKAARWLCAHDIDGVAVLAAVLARREGCGAARQSQCGTCIDCPLAAGVSIADRASQLETQAMIFDVAPVPVFLLPFAAVAARRLGTNVTVHGNGFEAVSDGVSLSMRGAPDGSEGVNVALGGTLGAPLAHVTRATPDMHAWNALSALAHRTYAPATEESRLLGAGAGTSDND